MSLITNLVLLLNLSLISVTHASEAHSFTFNEVGKKSIINPKALLTQKDFVSAKVIDQGNRVLLQMTLTPHGAEVLNHFSDAHTGEKLAIVEEGRTVATPTIRVPIADGKLEIDALSLADANQIVEMINQK